jgi:hypothetical protein
LPRTGPKEAILPPVLTCINFPGERQKRFLIDLIMSKKAPNPDKSKENISYFRD